MVAGSTRTGRKHTKIGGEDVAEHIEGPDEREDARPQDAHSHVGPRTAETAEPEATERGARERQAGERQADALTAETAPTSRGVAEKLAEGSLEAAMAASRGRYGERWDRIQAGFVDDPRRTVEEADRLVREVVEEMARACTDERQRLAGTWSAGGADTEAMRTALQRYRHLFGFALR
jgi:hypothetical protein